MREKHDWHKGYWMGDINFLLICSQMSKHLSEEEFGKYCIYIHYILRDDKYIAWFSFSNEEERDDFWLHSINDKWLESIVLCAITNESDGIETKNSDK